jgi:RNA polymerase sigma factor (sigma-70 family)
MHGHPAQVASVEEWIAELQRGGSDAAWDLFLGRYRRVVFGAIRHYFQDYDDVMDVFARVCEALREDDFRRLRSWINQPEHRASFSTWLVTVVRHLTIDWLRRTDRRPALSAAEGLPPLQRRIFEHVFIEQRSHVETYELIRTREASTLTFRQFLAELRAMYRATTKGRKGWALRELAAAPPPDPEPDDATVTMAAETRGLLDQALGSLGDADRVALQLFVVEELPAAAVAKILGLPNAKAVYNRVYRALAAVREHLEQAGIHRGDL